LIKIYAETSQFYTFLDCDFSPETTGHMK